VAEAILDIVAENPQGQHVSAEMQPAAVHEHRREERWHVGRWMRPEAAGNERPLFHERVAAAEFDEEQQQVQCDERIRDDRKGVLAAVSSPIGNIESRSSYRRRASTG
jgi:hypothetical protein